MKKLIILAVLLITGILLLIFKVYKSLMLDPQKAGKEQAAHLPQSKQTDKKDKVPKDETEKIQFASEQLRGYSDKRRAGHVGPPWCKTTDGFYMQGEMSAHGLVEAIRCPDLSRAYVVIRCATEKHTVYIIAGDVVKIEVDKTPKRDENSRTL